MKHFITLISIIILSAININIYAQSNSLAYEKSNAERIIAEYNHYESIKIIEFGNIQTFPYDVRKISDRSLLILKEASYISQRMLDAFHAENTDEAIKLLRECKDSTYRFKDEWIPSSNTLDNLYLVTTDPALYLDKNLNDEFSTTMNARKVIYVLPNSSIKFTEVLIYNENGEIQYLGTSFTNRVVDLFNSCTDFHNSFRELFNELDNWENEEYNIVR